MHEFEWVYNGFINLPIHNLFNYVRGKEKSQVAQDEATPSPSPSTPTQIQHRKTTQRHRQRKTQEQINVTYKTLCHMQVHVTNNT